MAGLWKVEDEIRGQYPAIRAAGRQKRSAAIVAELFALWETELRRIPGKSKLDGSKNRNCWAMSGAGRSVLG